jgi:hypothetical protein
MQRQAANRAAWANYDQQAATNNFLAKRGDITYGQAHQRNELLKYSTLTSLGPRC